MKTIHTMRLPVIPRYLGFLILLVVAMQQAPAQSALKYLQHKASDGKHVFSHHMPMAYYELAQRIYGVQ